MTSTVVAAAEAAHELGAEEVIVSDCHGNAQNILIDRLPDYVRIIRAWPRPLSVMQGIEMGEYAGALMLGYHACATNPEGGLAHSFMGWAIRAIRIGGVTMNEASVGAAIAGHFGLPVILVSGDDKFCAETVGLIGPVETAVVKHAYNYNAALTTTPAVACGIVAAATKRAIERRASMRPYRFEAPIELEVEFKHRPPVDLWSFIKFVERRDAFTIRYKADDMVEVAGFLSFLFGYNATLK